MENNSEIIRGWSWWTSIGLPIIYLWNKQYWAFVLYCILNVIPFVNFVAIIVYFIYGWLKGKELIFNSEKFETEEEKIWIIKFFENFWKSSMIFISIFAVFFLILFLWMWAFMLSYLNHSWYGMWLDSLLRY